MGSEHPVAVQSMLNRDTMDTLACVEQVSRIAAAGGELARITAPGVREAENLKEIGEACRLRGCTVPLSADIHFNPEAAMVAACYVEKIRINPGNFVDKRATFQAELYSEEAYEEELQRLREKFTRLLARCRERGVAIRIGTNHGSLSDRIMSRYGNTPAGMVEATMEYTRVCRDEGFDQVVISLKSSDCRVMVEAVRLLVQQMNKEGMHYPLHLGVTEAGEGEDGRIRSAVGIGTLLNEGLGDTIRVSLTEEPEQEIPVAREIIRLATPDYRDSFPRMEPRCLKPVIVADISATHSIHETVMAGLGFSLGKEDDPVYGDMLEAGICSPEIIYTEALGPELTKLPPSVTVVVPYDTLDVAHVYNRNARPLVHVARFEGLPPAEREDAFLSITGEDALSEETVNLLRHYPGVTLVASPGDGTYSGYRRVIESLVERGMNNRIIVQVTSREKNPETIALAAAIHVGGLFLDRLADGLWISTPEVEDPTFGLKLSRDILQSAGVRRYKTEFISCPGCGRTLFNLQETTRQVKAAFGHLYQLKIAVMGCIVNGPGEMGDADYGYIGAGNGKVNLYKGGTRVLQQVPEEQAIEALRQVMVEVGDYREP